MKSNDFDAKYEAAMKYYNNNAYTKAIQIFENLTMHYRGREHSEDILWYYAQSLLHESDYLSASYQFSRFAKQYPYSKNAEEAEFQAAYCKYADAPEYTLDQSLTRQAVSDFELFAEKHPNSVHLPEVNRYLDEMRHLLMKKDYEIAYGYYHIEAYHAAYISLNNFLNLYPESPFREDAMFYVLTSSYQYASNSTEDKMKERLEQVLNDFEKFNASYPNSKHKTEAQNIYTKTRELLSKIGK